MIRTKKIAILAIIAMVLTMMPAAMFAADSDRLAGAGRVETALAIADAGWETADTVVLAPADQANLVDALAAAPLAGQEDAPILLTFKGALSPAVADKIEELGASTVYVVGAISDDVVAEVEAIDGVTAEKLAGANRWATADAINAKLVDPAGSFVVGYNALADALSVASYAAANGYAIVLTKADGTVDESKLLGDVVYLVGGTGVVKDYADADDRFGGADRFATNRAVAEGLEFSYDTVYVANGISMVDALAVAPLAAQASSFVLLSSANDVTPVDGITAATKVIAVGGVGVVPASVVAKVVPASDELEVVSVSATNLKEVVVKFNQAIDEDELDTSDFDVDGATVADVELDGTNTVVVTVTDALDNDEEYDITIDGIVAANGDELADEVEMTFTTADYELPVIETIEFVGPQTARIVFSEPIDSVGSAAAGAEVSVDAGVYSASIESYSGNKVTVDLGTELEEGKHTFKVKNFTDYVPYTMVAKTVTVTYTDITDAPTVTVKEAKQEYVKLKFNRPVTNIGVESFYQTYSSWMPLEVLDKDGATIDDDGTDDAVSDVDYWDEVKLVFSNGSSDDKPLPVGKTKVVVKAEVDDVEIEDRWENTLDGDVTLYATITADTEKPTVKKITVEAENEIRIYYSEDMDQTEAADEDNYTFTDPDGDEIESYKYGATYNAENDYVTILFDDDLDHGEYTVKIEGQKDASLNENPLGVVTKTFTISDETGLDYDEISVSMIDADRIIYVKFDEEPATTGAYSALNPDNYLYDGAKLDDDVKLSMFTSKIVKILFPSGTDLDADDDGDLDVAFAIGRIADKAGNLSSDFSKPFAAEAITEEEGPVVTEVRKVDENKLDIIVSDELKSVSASGVIVDGDGDGDDDVVASISFENDGDDTVIHVTLKAAEKSVGTEGLVATAYVEIAADKIKSVTGAYMENVVYAADSDDVAGATEVAFKDKCAPELLETAGDGDDPNVWIDNVAGADNLLDVIVLEYSEAIKANSVSKYTYKVNGYKVLSAVVTAGDDTDLSGEVTLDEVLADAADGIDTPGNGKWVVLTIDNADDDEDNDLDATPSVTQQYDIEDVADNKYKNSDSVKAINLV